jgi:flagellin
MGLRINTNIMSLVAMRHLGNNSDAQKTALERMASGSKINRASDDAAGLAISERLKAEVRSMKQAQKNANDGVSLIQVAEGAMNEVSNILVRLRELSIESASDTVGDVERGFLNKEVVQLKEEINRISGATQFGAIHLLDGSASLLEFQVGTKNNPLNDRFVFDTQELNTTINALGLDGVSADTKVGAQNNLGMLDHAIERLNGNRATLGALQNRIQSTINNLATYRENIEAANSRIRDADMAEESSQLIKTNILNQAGIAVLAQANQSPQLALKLLG